MTSWTGPCLEVPLVFPGAEWTAAWHFSPQEGQWTVLHHSNNNNNNSTNISTNNNSIEDWQGLASITSVSNEITLTSCAVPEEPNVIVLSKLVISAAPVVVRYTLPSAVIVNSTVNDDDDNNDGMTEDNIPNTTTTTTHSMILQTVLHVLDVGTVVRVVLVETTGKIHYWHVRVNDLSPVTEEKNNNGVITWDIADALPRTMAGETSNPTATDDPFSLTTWLRKAAISFVSERVLLVAWTPWLVAFDLLSGRATLWSSSLTLERMKARQSTISSLVFGSLQYLAGTGTGGNAISAADAVYLQDMTAILATATTVTADDGHSVAYSWHDGGILRQWILPISSQQQQQQLRSNTTHEPTHVYEYDLAQFLPTALEGARLKAAPVEADGLWTLAVYATTPPGLFIVQGRIPDAENLKKKKAVEPPAVTVLNIPPDASLVTWQWAPFQSLQTLWQSTRSGSGAVEWTQCTYSMTSLTATNHDPVHVADDHFLNASSEERYLQHLDFTTDLISAADLSQALHTLDQRFLQYLLRPARVRGTGTILPPSRSILLQALADLTGSTTVASTISSSSPSSSIGVIILLALHEWRNQLQMGRHTSSSAASGSSPFMTPRRTSKSGTFTDVASPIGGTPAHKTPRSIYESLQYKTAAAAAATAATMASPTTPTVALAPYTMRIVATQVQEYQDCCWKKFLLRVWELESSRRSILQVSWLPMAVATGQADQAICIRGDGHISVLTRAQPRATRDGPQAVLDNAAIRLLAAITDDDENEEQHAITLLKAEQALWIDFQSGKFALDASGCLEEFENRIAVVGQAVLWETGVLEDANDFIHCFEDDEIPLETHIRELQRLPLGYGLEGLNLLPIDDPEEPQTAGASSTMNQRQNNHDLENVHWRLSSVALGVQCLDSMRRLMLGRYMVLKNVGVGPALTHVALCGYLQCVSLLLTSAQHVPIPLTLMTSVNEQFPVLALGDEKSPPKKRPSIDSQMTSLLEEALGVKQKTTVMDAFQIRIARNGQSAMDTNSAPSLLEWPILVIKAMFKTLFELKHQQLVAGTDLPELTILKSSPVKEIMEHPRLAMWLLSPTQAVKTGASEQRRAAVAQCLLRLAEDETESVGNAMAARAFHLLRFNAHQFEQGVERIIKLHYYLGDRSRFIGDLLDLIERAVDECTNAYTNEIWKQRNFGKLLDLYFSAAMQARQWRKAAGAAIMHANPKSRSDNLKRLTRHMVDSGALADLKFRCSLKEDDLSGQRLEGVDLYATAMEYFGDLAPRDMYLHSVHAKEPLSDYQSALFVLHVANHEWKRAAEAMDLRYVNAWQALLKESDSLAGEDAQKRERLAVEDLALSACACAFSMDQIEDQTSAYLVSGQSSTNYATVPLQLLSQTPGARSKRSRASSTQQGEEKHSDGTQYYMRTVDTRLRAARAFCFQMLHKAGKVGVAEASVFLQEPLCRERTQLLISQMFKNGFYQYGLVLAKALRETLTGTYMGLDVVHDAASHLACEFLIPLMLGQENFAKPSIQQLRADLDAIASGSSACVPLPSKSLKSTESTASTIRQLAGEILRHVTINYTSSATPLAKDVVQTLLGVYGPAPLPEWLHNLMVHGASISDEFTPGLFAKRTSTQCGVFSGDPSFLLTQYTRSGMLEHACRTVIEALEVHKQSKAAAKRLPEKGNIDWVPYRKIDFLYNLINVTLRKGRFTKEQEERIKKSQKTMVDTLERHFELLKISEMGLMSARALP